MGLVTFIKRLFDAKNDSPTSGAVSTGDNFRFVAQNVAAIYCIVERSLFGMTLNKVQKLYATALIDMYTYLSRGVYQPLDVAMAVDFASGGIVSLFPYNRVHGLLDRDENADLINLAMQLEAMIFSIDTNISDNEIIDLVISEKGTISTAVNQIVSQGSKGSYYQQLYNYVQKHTTEPSFQNIVLACENFQDEDQKTHIYTCKNCGKVLTALHTKCDYCGGSIEIT